jgi:hypothetical protein
MARISTYGLDAKPELADKVIGTDVLGSNKTKNYTLGEISDLINNTNSQAVADQSVFLFQDDLSEGRARGTISFIAGGGNQQSFETVTTILLSKTGAGGKDIRNFLPLFAGKDIILAQSNDVNQFGTYRVGTITDYAADNAFFEVSLVNYTFNGAFGQGLHYIFGEFVNPANSGDLNFTFTQSSAQQVWTIQHNLGKNPSVSVADTAGSWVVGQINYINNNELTITFNASFQGVAYLN